MVKLYEPRMHVFLSNDLEATTTCFPPKVAAKKGRHHVVRMQSGTRPRQRQPLIEGEYEDAQGNLFHRYPLQDDPERAKPMPTLETLQRSEIQ